VGTAKRERQKANRQIRLEEIAKQARRDKTRRTGVRVGVVLAAVIALVGVVYLVSDHGSTSTASTATTIPGSLPTGGTLSGPTTTVPPRPAIKVPTSIPTKLVVTELRAGTGPKAKAGDTVDVHYMGVLSKNGTQFDNSYDRKQSFKLVLGAGNVIKGWDQGLVGVQAGGRYQLDIPADLAYGATGQGSIGPNEALTFVVDVMAVIPAANTGTSVTPTA
jgi:peptidylprolyl isomerase